MKEDLGEIISAIMHPNDHRSTIADNFFDYFKLLTRFVLESLSLTLNLLINSTTISVTVHYCVHEIFF